MFGISTFAGSPFASQEGPAPQSGTYNLTGNTGAYSIAGADASLHRNRRLLGSTATYNVLSAGVLTYARKMLAVPASYLTTGSGATFLHGIYMAGNAGTYAVATAPINIYRTYGTSPSDLAFLVSASKNLGYNRVMVDFHAAYSVQYPTATLFFGIYLNGLAPSYVVSTRPVLAARNRIMVRDAGTYGVIGKAQRFAFHHVIIGQGNTYSLTTQDGELTLGFNLFGTPARYMVQSTATLSMQHRMQGQVAAYATVGRAAMTSVTRYLGGLTCRVYITTAEIQAARHRASQFTPGSYVVVARMSTLISKRKLQGTPGHEAVQPFAVTGRVTRRLVGLPAHYGVQGSQAQLGYPRGIGAGTGHSFGVAGSPAALAVRRRMSSTPMLVEVLAAPAILTYSGSIVGDDGVSPAFKVQSDLELVTVSEGTLSNDPNLSNG